MKIPCCYKTRLGRLGKLKIKETRPEDWKVGTLNICLATKLLSAVGITTRMTIKGELPQFMVRELLVKTVSLQSGGKNGNMTINEESLLCMKDTCLILGLLTKPTTNGGRRGNTRKVRFQNFTKLMTYYFLTEKKPMVGGRHTGRFTTQSPTMRMGPRHPLGIGIGQIPNRLAPQSRLTQMN